MGDPTDEEVADIARAVEAGEDQIAVPAELLQEPPPPARSLYARIVTMTVAEKVKLALRGNQDARAILIRDTNKLIRRCVLHNPRLTDAEVVAIAGNRSSDDDSLRFIAEKREWVANAEVRRALAVNPKTPIPLALRFVGLLPDRELRLVARSKNVPEAVAAQARRLLAARQERK